jgi:hypothetical protein
MGKIADAGLLSQTWQSGDVILRDRDERIGAATHPDFTLPRLVTTERTQGSLHDFSLGVA